MRRKTPAARTAKNRYWDFETTPIPAEDGLTARSQTGSFTRSWWASRWVKALTQVMDPSRLARGRAYARGGQVVKLDLSVGLISALVQGTRPKPYRVRLEIKPLEEAAWDRVIQALAGQALYAAQLLNGEMPHDVETAFRAAGVSLFPLGPGDLQTSCTCPDWVRPCKHVAAVCLLVGERLDEDPFLLFLLRGRTKEQVMEALRARRAEGLEMPRSAAQTPLPQASPPDQDLRKRLDDFWKMGDALRELSLRVAPPEVELAVLKVLGEPAFAEDETLLDRLGEIYRAVSQRALEVAFGEAAPAPESDETASQ